MLRQIVAIQREGTFNECVKEIFGVNEGTNVLFSGLCFSLIWNRMCPDHICFDYFPWLNGSESLSTFFPASKGGVSLQTFYPRRSSILHKGNVWIGSIVSLNGLPGHAILWRPSRTQMCPGL